MVPGMTRETPIVKATLLAAGGRPDARVWRNNTGALRDQDGRLVRFGLPGSADIIGLQRVLITPEMVGRYIGRLIALECKQPGRKPTEKQRKFGAMVEAMGGLYVVITDPAEVAAALQEGLPNVKAR